MTKSCRLIGEYDNRSSLTPLTNPVDHNYTTDTPSGNFSEFDKQSELSKQKKEIKSSFVIAAIDYRVWVLFILYGACFGVELTINNIAAIYYKDYFQLNLQTAGFIAGLFGFMNLFSRTLGGMLGDKAGTKWGLKGRVYILFVVLLLEGLALILFSQMTNLSLAIFCMILFSLFVQASEGAIYSVVPFLNKQAIGSISGIVGAGGNTGAVAAGFLFKSDNISYPDALFFMGCVVIFIACGSSRKAVDKTTKFAMHLALIEPIFEFAMVLIQSEFLNNH